MSLHEPHRPTPNNYIYQVLDQLQRATAPGRPSAAFVDLCDRASIPRDLRKQLLDQLVTGRYVTRHGGDVQITKTGEQLAAAAQGRLPERKPGR